MPNYRYRCPQCGRVEEAMHKAGERLPLFCQHCEVPLEWQFPTPALRTDTTFMAGRPDAGTHGFYSHQLGCTVSSRDDVKRICQQRGYGCEELGVAVREPERDPFDGPYRVADDIVEREVDRVVDTQHGGKLDAKKRAVLKDATADRLKGSG